MEPDLLALPESDPYHVLSNQVVRSQRHGTVRLSPHWRSRYRSIHRRGIPEYEEIVVSTSTCSKEDLSEIYLYSWSFLTLHSLGILKHVAEYYNQNYGLQFIKFYETFLEFCRSKESTFSEEFKKIVQYRDAGYSGKGWDHHDPNLGDINWPIEEASWLRLSYDKNRLQSSIQALLEFIEQKYNYTSSSQILKDLTKFQVFLLTTRDNKDETKIELFEYNWKDFFVSNIPLKQTSKTYYYKNRVREEDSTTWNYKVIWYGRRSHDYKCDPEDLQEEHAKEITDELRVEPLMPRVH